MSNNPMNAANKVRRIICLYGGPNSGKSTTCSGLHHFIKLAGRGAEMNREYIKEWVWEGRSPQDGDQNYFFAKQARKERVLMKNSIEFIITDSPLILGLYYGSQRDRFEQMSTALEPALRQQHIAAQFYGYKIDHFLILRDPDQTYDPNGRYETAGEATECDTGIKWMLESKGISYEPVPKRHAVPMILRNYGIKCNVYADT